MAGLNTRLAAGQEKRFKALVAKTLVSIVMRKVMLYISDLIGALFPNELLWEAIPKQVVARSKAA